MSTIKTDELKHHGIKGMKWGVRRYQNKDGSLTPEGKKRAKVTPSLYGAAVRKAQSDAKKSNKERVKSGEKLSMKEKHNNIKLARKKTTEILLGPDSPLRDATIKDAKKYRRDELTTKAINAAISTIGMTAVSKYYESKLM